MPAKASVLDLVAINKTGERSNMKNAKFISWKENERALLYYHKHGLSITPEKLALKEMLQAAVTLKKNLTMLHVLV